MQIIHSLLWGVATPGKLGSNYSQAVMFFIFDAFKSILFFVNLTLFRYFFHVLKNIIILCLLILPPQVVVDGLQVQISQEIHPLFRGVATSDEDRPELQFRPFALRFFVPALLLSMLTHLFLSSFLSLPYFILADPMRKCLGKHSCMSSFPIVILNDTSFFSDSATTSAQKRIRCEMTTLANAYIVTLYQLY